VTDNREKAHMKASGKTATRPLRPEQQLRGLIAKFKPKSQTLIRSVMKSLRKRLPTANELVYDYSKSLVIGYSPMERGSDSVVAVALGEEGLRLYFNRGPELPDPKKLLLGSGKQTRFIWIDSPGTLKLPEVNALLESAIDKSKTPLPGSRKGKLIIKPKSAK
jgi:hypothetical protein